MKKNPPTDNIAKAKALAKLLKDLDTHLDDELFSSALELIGLVKDHIVELLNAEG